MNEELQHLPMYWQAIVKSALEAEYRRGYATGYTSGQADAIEKVAGA